ncbi:Ubiquinol oxidase 4, chloroplastic/chromoplastic [Linum perenne]
MYGSFYASYTCYHLIPLILVLLTTILSFRILSTFLSVILHTRTCSKARRYKHVRMLVWHSHGVLFHMPMLELGGNNWWFDRFLAQHVAVFYYFMTVFMYALSPRMAYHFSECVEHHAFSTYDKFIKANEDELKELPAPEVAVRYYTGGDLYLFDEFQTSRSPNTRRPKIDTLYDTFVNIREDEGEHCKTMKACQTPGNLHSPHAYSDDDDAAGEDDECVVSEVECQGIVDCIKKSVSSGPTKQKV